MIVAITGSRDNVGPSVVQRGLAEWLKLYVYSNDHQLDDLAQLEFRCGDARGVDLYARDWLRRQGYVVDVYCASDANAEQLECMLTRAAERDRTSYRRIIRCSDWERDGKQAGNIRNAHMLQRPELAHLLLKFHDGSSPGTRNCADVAEQLGIEVVDGVALAGGA